MLDLLLPRRCVVCGAPRTLLCDGCRAGLPMLRPPLCTRCGAPTVWPVARCRECAGRRLAFTRARSATEYDASVRRLLRSWKERGVRSLGGAAALVIVERLGRPDAEVVTFVPPDRGRRLERGYHPAEQLARAVASAWELPCESLLTRTAGARQRGLSRTERRRNVAHAFSGDAEGRRVVLVDDVYTTGATAHAAAKALHTAVEVVTFARATRTS